MSTSDNGAVVAEPTIAAPKPIEKPILETQSFEEIIPQIIADQYCKYAGCHGRGYIGISIDPKDGHKTILLCKCAHFEARGYVQIVQQLNKLDKGQQVLFTGIQMMMDRIEEIESKKFSVRIKKLFKKNAKLPQRALPSLQTSKSPPSVQQH